MTALVASRDGYGEGLMQLADDERVVVLEADLGKSTKSCRFREMYPERTFSLGISEQNMMLVAAGLASSGYKPFASTFAIFVASNRFVTESHAPITLCTCVDPMGVCTRERTVPRLNR